MIKKKYPVFHELKKNQTMTVSHFWSECVTQAIACFCCVIVMLIIVSVIIGNDIQRVNQIAEYASIGLVVLWCIPIARNTRYRLRDAGYGPKTYLWLLLPFVGWIVFVVCLCAKSIQKTPEGHRC